MHRWSFVRVRVSPDCYNFYIYNTQVTFYSARIFTDAGLAGSAIQYAVVGTNVALVVATVVGVRIIKQTF